MPKQVRILNCHRAIEVVIPTPATIVVSVPSKAFGEYLHLTRVRNLQWGSYLHDIGKVGILIYSAAQFEKLSTSKGGKL